MRSRKAFSRIALLATLVVVSVGASSGVAEGTALCSANETPCAVNQVNSLHLVNTAGTTVDMRLIGGIELTVLCLNLLWQANVLGLAAIQIIHTTELNITNCGTNAGHNNCTVNTAIELPSFELLSNTPNLGVMQAIDGKMLVRCVIGGIIVCDCVYSLAGSVVGVEGALHSGASTGHGMFRWLAMAPGLSPEKGLCAKETQLESLLEPLQHIWVST